MATSRTITELRNSALDEADMRQLGTGPAFVTDAEVDDRINDSLANLWALIMEGDGEQLLAKREEQTAITPTLPTDFAEMLRMDVFSGDQWLKMERLAPEDEEIAAAATGYQPLVYVIEGAALQSAATLYVLPVPATAQTYRIRYIPESPVIDDATPLVLPNRWWSWVQLDVAAWLLTKGSEDPRALLGRRDGVGVSIMKQARRTNRGEPRFIRRVR